MGPPPAEGQPEAADAPLEAQGHEQHPSTPDPSHGLTPASLKHLRRQRDALASERERHVAEISRLQALVRDQQAELESEARLREDLRREIEEARSLASQEVDVGAIRASLEEALRSREAEIAELQRAFQDERRRLEQAVEAAAQAGEKRLRMALAPVEEHAEELEEMVELLRGEKQALEQEQQRLEQDRDQWKKRAREAETAAESASQVHEQYKRDMDKLRPDLVTKVIRSKIELHICVPRVALEYPDGDPVIVDMAEGLGKEHVRRFLQNKVFPQFDPLWMCLDGVDRAPDGTNKKAYTARILELLTDRLKDFVDEFRLKMDDSPSTSAPEDDACDPLPRGPGRGRRPLQH